MLGMKMKSDVKKIGALGLVLLVVTLLAACLGAPEKNGKPTVVATIFPYYDAVRAIGGDKINAELLLDGSQEVHDFQASMANKTTVDSAKLIVRNGLELDDWKIFTGIKAKICIVGDTVEKQILISSPGEHGHANPHVWLDPLVQKHAAAVIRDALIEIDPINRQAYTENAASYMSQIDALHMDWSRETEKLSKRSFIGFHDAYQYLANRYDLKQVETVEDADKTGLTQEKKERVRAALKAKKASVIFAEDEASRKNIESIVGDLGATVGVLQPLEYAGKNDTYVSVMEQNLEAIKKAMK